MSSLRADLSRIAQFAANLTDAYSSFVFIPADIALRLDPEARFDRGEALKIIGHHSLSNEVNHDVALQPGCSLVGWVAKNKQPIQVATFDRDTKTLGVYTRDEEIKSFLAVPIKLHDPAYPVSGVLAVDSKKAYAFSKQQTKLLDDVAGQATALLRLHASLSELEMRQGSWGQFIRQAHTLVNTLGALSVEVIRMRITNTPHLESNHGTEKTNHVLDQLLRLIQQTVPPHFPVYRNTSGDIILIVDNMMTSFFQNKIAALCDHLKSKGIEVHYQFQSRGVTKATLDTTIEGLIANTALMQQEVIQGVAHGERRSRY